jgi:hypothetical protein
MIAGEKTTGVSMRTNVLFIAVITFLAALRFGWLGGDETATVPSRLEHAAQRLTEYYRDGAATPGWRVTGVQAEPEAVAVRVHIPAAERGAVASAPPVLRTARLGALCPVYNHRVWDMFSGGQHIRIDGVDDAGEVFLSHTCPRRGV